MTALTKLILAAASAMTMFAEQPGDRVATRIDIEVNNFTQTKTLYTVPEGKRLVIEHVGYYGESRALPSLDKLALRFSTNQREQVTQVTLRRTAANGAIQWTKLTRELNADSGTAVRVELRKMHSEKVKGYITLKGYLCDVP